MNQSAREVEWGNWLRLAVDGDAVAYDRFLRAVTPYLRSMARKRCNMLGVSAGEAEDVVQEVLLAVHLKRATWDTSRPIGPWLSTIVRNKMIDSFRKRGRHISVPIDDVMETLQAEDRRSGLEPVDLEKMLAGLRDPQREIVRSISVSGDGIRETAERLKMSEGAVRVVLHRALKGLAMLYRSE
ncbi:sigma-70 family RNA polymerase sigma factor [Rhizobium sp. FKY42]|uniref:sigma-70 family RNA polymerase sigma factor n=1 Tax=Rhizobium sp. FKY42 TaxID=2562310 RepID=UPI0010C04C87|nr:sigma-70 family RNA polymerase sigma factor [Rhizobium sp. FKY42]